MNLIKKPWIPVTFLDGSCSLLGLEELFVNAQDIKDLNMTPPQRIALARLLICVTQAALDGPEDEDSWSMCLDKIPETVRAYLDRWKDRFDLYGKHSFLVNDTVEPTDNATIDKLDFGLASGNNSTLFDHAADINGRVQDDVFIALNLLTFQCFSPGGKIGIAKWAGQNTEPAKGTSEHAPCLESSGLHTIVCGDNLLETLHNNLLTKRNVKDDLRCEWGFPIWEQFPESQSDPVVQTLVSSYLGRLVPLSRCITLQPGKTKMTLANGLAYPKIPSFRDPMMTAVMKGPEKKKIPGYLSVDVNRHIWRDLESVLKLSSRDGENGPIALRHFETVPTDRKLMLWTGGIAADKAKIVDFAEWTISFTANMLNELELEKYSKGVAMARSAEIALARAVKSYASQMKADANTFIRSALLIFWSRVDAQCDMLIDTASDFNADFTQWSDLLKTEMRQAFDWACPHDNPRQIQAYALAKRNFRLNKTKKNKKEKKEVIS